MHLYDLLKRRRMVRNYRPDPIPSPALERILEAALRGPSAGASEGLALVVVEEASQRQAIATLAQEERWLAKGYPAWLSQAPVHLILCCQPERYRQRYAKPDKTKSRLAEEFSIPYWYVDAGAAFMTILLAAVEEGLAAGFQGAHNLPGLSELLAIPSEIVVLGVITLGYPLPDKRSLPIEQGQRARTGTIHRGKWLFEPQ